MTLKKKAFENTVGKGENAGYFLVFLRWFNPLPDDKISDWSKLKQSADDNFRFDENSRKFL